MTIFTFIAAVLLFALRWFLLAAAGNGKSIFHAFAVANLDDIEKVTTVALVICGAILFDRFLRRFYWHGYVKRRRGRDTPRLLLDLMTLLVILAAVAICLLQQNYLSLAGVAATSIAVAAAVGVAR